MKHEIQGAVRKLQNLQVPPSVRLDQAVRPEDLILRRNLLSEVMDQSLSKVLKVIRDPRLAVALVNAQVRMQGRAQVPFPCDYTAKSTSRVKVKWCLAKASV